MVEIINGINDGSNTVSAVALLAVGADTIRIGVRGKRPTEITYAGKTWTATRQLTEAGGGHLAYCYIPKGEATTDHRSTPGGGRRAEKT